MPELHDIASQHIDEMVEKTKHLRKCAEEKMKDYPLAEKMHKVVKAWESVIETMYKSRAARQITAAEQTTQTNGTGKQPTNNITTQMGQSERVLRP